MKETMVKQTVKVNPAEEHPGVSEKFFFWLNQANRSRQSCKSFEFGLWRAQFTGNLKSNFVIFLIKYAVFSGMVKLPAIWGSSVLDPFPLTINGLHLLHTTAQVNRCPHIDKIPGAVKTYFVAMWASLQLYLFNGFIFVWRQKYLNCLRRAASGSWWGHVLSSHNWLGYSIFCSMKDRHTLQECQADALSVFSTITAVI